jgi:Rod binding domain-containing protein
MRVDTSLSNPTIPVTGKQQNAKLEDAAQQFEAMLMQEILKPMRKGEDSWEGEKSEDSASDTISGFGTEALAKAVSRNGGIGIAQQVVRQISQEREKNSKK